MQVLGIRSPLKLISAIILCNLAGVIGAFFTSTGSGSWYDLLEKPWFNPPSFVFAPVWTTLYILMGIALYLVWVELDSSGMIENNRMKQIHLALGLFGGQLLLNTLWSVIFFGFQSVLYGLVEIVILWVVLLATIVTFWKINKIAAILLVPYLLWGSFATILTYAIFMLNA